MPELDDEEDDLEMSIFIVNTEHGGFVGADTYVGECGEVGVIFEFYPDPESVHFEDGDDGVYTCIEVVRYDPDDENGPTLWLRGVPKGAMVFVCCAPETWDQRFRRKNV